MFLRIIALTVLLLLNACHKEDLRGPVKKSNDGKTYLLIAEGNDCDQIKIDGKPWRHGIGEAGEVSPGVHTIECNGEIEFEIPRGVIFTFNYWGP